jgi:DNA phosphorothioation-dependent restriction protein DptG
MSDATQLLQEKNELERALFAVQEALQTSTTEKEELTKLFTDFKSHFDTVQGQAASYQKRLVEEMGARKSIED